MSVRYTKVGETWALRSEQPFPFVNFPVQVTKANGERKSEVAGELIGKVEGRFPAFIYAIVKAAPAPAPAAQEIGDLSGVLALFAQAKVNLKFPKIVLQVSEYLTVRLSVAGDRAKVPGSINVSNLETNGNVDNYGNPEHDWFGRVLTSGSYEPSRRTDAAVTAKIASRLRELASEPAKVASEFGRLTGNCCFCNRALEDERSTAVGYGKTCAKNFGLPWGTAKQQFVAEEVKEVA